MSSSNKKKVNQKIKSIFSRPHQKKNFEQNSDNPQIQEIQLAFALTGLGQSDLFSPFFPLHRLICAKLIDFFISIKTVDELVSVAQWGRDNINPNLFYYAFAAAIIHRNDTKDVLLPSPCELFPDKFFPAELFQHAVEELAVVPDGSRVIFLIISFANKYFVKYENFLHLGPNSC